MSRPPVQRYSSPDPVRPLFFPLIASYWLDIIYPCSHWSTIAGCLGARQSVPNQRHGHRYGDTQVPGPVTPVLPLFFPLLAFYWLDNIYSCSHWSITAGCPGARQRVPNQRHGHRYGDTQVSGSPWPRILHHTRR
jgi:hypothetical protein